MNCIKNRYNIVILGILFGFFSVSIVFLFLPSDNLKIQNNNIDLEFNSNNAYDYVKDQLNIGFRIPGTEESINCSKYFISKFLEIDNNFTYVQHNFTVFSTENQNVLFKLNENEKNIIILGAHYDSRAKATKDPITSNRNLPIPGANDGASGSAVLIELANILYTQRENLSCQIWFLFFDAEDQGKDISYGIDGWDWCEGSKKFVKEINNFYNHETEKFEAMILLDMVGGESLQFINEQYSTSSLLDELFEIGRTLGYISQFPSNPQNARIIDDQKAFVDIGIPTADLIINFWDNPDWPYHHTVNDDISHISNESLEITGKTIEQFIYNNYLNGASYTYVANYPWNIDINKNEFQIVLIFIVIISVVGITIVVLVMLEKDDKNKNI